MVIHCWKCQTPNWLGSQVRCFVCGGILRRCVDCSNYEPGVHHCAALDLNVNPLAASRPYLLCASSNCSAFQPKADVLAPETR